MSTLQTTILKHPDSGTNNIRFDSSGRVGFGGADTPVGVVTIYDSSSAYLYFQNSASGTSGGDGFSILHHSSLDTFIANRDSGDIAFETGGSEALRIDSDGRLLVGQSSARTGFFNVNAITPALQVETTAQVDDGRMISLVSNAGASSGYSPTFIFGKSRGTTAGGEDLVVNGDELGAISFQGADGDNLVEAARIASHADAVCSGNDIPGRLTFSTTADNEASPRARMTINRLGQVDIGETNNGYLIVRTPQGAPLTLNRTDTDGTLIQFKQDGTNEGSILVSGSLVSLSGAHLSRWSQLPGGAQRIEILRGSVLSNLDEMCEWAYEAKDAVLYTEADELPEGVSVGDVKEPARAAGSEDNEQLNRMKVSDIEGDKNVAGVFMAWDDDDDTYTNDFFCAMTGDHVIRIGQGVTVTRGDLLMSAGDGTAKPQGDDIVRSKTVAKVTSTTVSETYADGSYCVPCVLMAC